VLLAVRNGRGRQAAAASGVTFVFLLPVLHLVPLEGAVAAERFLYLPSVGLALLTSLAWVALERERLPRLASRAALCAAIIIGVVLSTRGARPWASDATLFARMVVVSPRAATAHRGLADVLTRGGNYSEAARECREAIRLDPGFTDAYELLGVVSARQGEKANAREAFEAALRLAPNRASIHANLGVLAFDQGEFDTAVARFRRAAELEPESNDVRYKLGCALVMVGDTDGATREAARLDRMDPELARALRQLLESRAQPGR
jgi:Tfp pilus assembly protein PilF